MKTRNILHMPIFLAAAVVVVLAAATPKASAWGINGIEFDEAKLYFELNDTDGDLGVQFMLDGEPWKRIFVISPDWRKLLDVKVKGNARVVGLTELFIESSEPPLSEFSMQDWFNIYPEGEYMYFGVTVENELLYGTAELTHNIPDAPEILNPIEDSVVDPEDPLVVEWETVDDPNPPDSVIVAYHVVVEKDVEDERLRVLAIDMLPTDTTMTVPPEFLEFDKEYKVEILAVESSGNQTITEISFETEEE